MSQIVIFTLNTVKLPSKKLAISEAGYYVCVEFVCSYYLGYDKIFNPSNLLNTVPALPETQDRIGIEIPNLRTKPTRK